ncbi:MAG TPA: hypothetical protein VMR28_03485 [Candidatus Saccharimonadales bacterium]|nr:hypothetical protein [Candidatus Saccharimonadales bacterium]
MEIEQPDPSESEEIVRNHDGKKTRHRNHKKPKSASTHNPSHNDQPKSLRDNWEETLNHKKDENADFASTVKEHVSPHSHDYEGALPLVGMAEDEISLHPDAHQLHERVQEGREEAVDMDRPDPVWEPWCSSPTVEQTVKDLAAPAATMRAEVSVDSEPLLVPQVEAVQPQPEVSEPTPSYTSIESPESSQEAVNPSVLSNQPFRRETSLPSDQERAQTSNSSPYQAELPQEAQEIMQQLQTSSDRHLEQSAWHNIEVDNKTGKAVEQPSFAYGEEFKHEQRQEAVTDENPEDDEVAVASGQLAVGVTDMPSLNPNLSSADSSSTLPESENTIPQQPHSTMSGVPRLGGSMTDPVLWIIFGVIVFAIIIAAVL